MTPKKLKAPYSDTEVPADKTKFQIETLLRTYGAQGTQWTTAWDQERVQLKFAMPTSDGHQVMIRIDPPTFTAKRKNWNRTKGGYDIVEEPNWAQSMRLMHHYLKGKLEAVAWGLKDVEEEFLNDVLVHDQRGREATVGELIGRKALSQGQLERLPVAEERK